MTDREPTAAERKEAAAIRRRWINIGEILAVIGVVISALALWNGYAERKSSEEERAAEKAKQSTVSRLLILKAHGEGHRLELSPHNGEQAIQGQTILFPSMLGVGAIETTEARIQSDWVKQAVKSADEKTKAPGDARMPIAITTRFVSGGTAVTDAALYDVGYKRSGGGLFGGTNIDLRGLALIGRVKPAQAQARVDALWLARHPDT